MGSLNKSRSLWFCFVVLAFGMFAFANAAMAATCAPATSQGPSGPASWQTYCWIDMSTYNQATVFGGGQAFSITLSDGSVLSFTLSGNSPGGDTMLAVVAPAWSGAATGNTAFLGIPSKPILYTAAGGTVNLTLSNIKVTPPNGVVSTGQYKFVIADGESTNNGESLTFTTNGGAWTLDDKVNPISGAIFPTTSGTGTATFTETGVAGTVGAYIMGSLSPTTVNVQLVAGGLQGVMFAVQYSTITANKVISGNRANAADQFTYSIKATSNGSTLAAATSTGAANGPFGSAVATLSSSVSTTVSEVMAAGSVSQLAQYTTNLNCVNAASGSSTVLPSNQPVTSFNFGSTAYGDAVSCTFTNTAKPATVALQKITTSAIGGSFTFTATNLAAALPGITTSAMNTPAPASPSPINVTAFNTAVTITETPSANFVASAATCTDANAAVTGNPASFGTLVGNVLTIPAANVVAAAQITCTITNAINPNAATIALQKTTLGSAGGPFTFTATNLALPVPSISTASASTPYPTITTPILATATGTAVTITETVATNFTITTASCTDANAATSGNPAGTFGTVAANTLTIPAVNVRPKAQITCTFTNIVNPAIPLVAVQKITTGVPGGPFTFTATNLSGAVPNVTTTTAGTASPVAPNYISVTSILNPVTLTEAANSNFNLTTATCTDTNSGTTGNPASFGTLVGSVMTIPATNLKPFAKIVCTYTNAPKPPTLALQKITAGSFGGPFTFAATNLASIPGNITTVASNTAAPAAASPIQVTAAGTQVQITEAANASYTTTAASCTDANASFTGNPASFGSLAGNVLTVSAINVLPAAQINCIITNTAKPATVAIRKTTTGAPGGPFNFSVANLASAPANITTATAGTPAPAAPPAIGVTVLNAVVQVSEGFSTYFTLSGATCTDANAAITGNPASFGTVTGQLLTVPAANVLPAAQITCTFTNAGVAPKITFQKALSASGRIAAADQFKLTATGTGAPAAINTTGTVAAITSAPMSFTATANSAYSLTEAMAAGSTSLITAYAQTVACTNNNATGTNVSALSTMPVNFTIIATDDISCVVTNNGTPTPNLSIVKSASPSGPFSVGQTITYTYKVTNTGNVQVTNVKIADTHNGTGVFTGPNSETLTDVAPLGDSTDATANNGIWSLLGVGDTVTFKATYVVTQHDIDFLQ